MAMEPEDAKELIEEAIERSEAAENRQREAERTAERRFRDRVSILVGLFAVALAILHMAAAGNARESILRTIEASDIYNYMQAKIVRETVLRTAATEASLSSADRAAVIREADRLRAPDAAGHGIGQLEHAGAEARDGGEQAARVGERYEWGETALQLAIVLLSIAMVARSGVIVAGASMLAGAGVLVGLLTVTGLWR